MVVIAVIVADKSCCDETGCVALSRFGVITNNIPNKNTEAWDYIINVLYT